jgi:hypothetical protein
LTAQGLWFLAMWVCPELAVPALIMGYLVGPALVTWASSHYGWRERAIGATAELYGDVAGAQARMVYRPSPLLY